MEECLKMGQGGDLKKKKNETKEVIKNEII